MIMAIVTHALMVAVAVAASEENPLLPGLVAAAGSAGGVMLRGYDPMLGESRASVASFNFENLTEPNVWTEPESVKTFSVPDEIHVSTTTGGCRNVKCTGELHILHELVQAPLLRFVPLRRGP